MRRALSVLAVAAILTPVGSAWAMSIQRGARILSAYIGPATRELYGHTRTARTRHAGILSEACVHRRGGISCPFSVELTGYYIICQDGRCGLHSTELNGWAVVKRRGATDHCWLVGWVSGATCSSGTLGLAPRPEPTIQLLSYS